MGGAALIAAKYDIVCVLGEGGARGRGECVCVDVWVWL